MSDNKQQDLLDIAAKAEQDLNSPAMKQGQGTGHGGKTIPGVSSSTEESGIDQGVEEKFSEFGATADYGSHTSGQGGNRDIPESEGGDIVKGTGRLTKARDFDQGQAGEGPEDIAKSRAEQYGGEDDVRGNVRN